jgi:imidazolonepropionase-like amidohydrolase
MSAAETGLLALVGGRAIDGTGAAPIENAVVLVAGDRIRHLGPAEQVAVPPEATVRNVAGKTVMPGLIDAHLHLAGVRTINQIAIIAEEPHVRAIRAGQDAWRCLDAGFTTIRDAGCMTALYVKFAVEEGSIPGPRIVAAGRAISQTGGHGDIHFVPAAWAERLEFGRLADGVADVRRAAREQLREGADMLKIMTTGGVMSEKDKPTSCQYSMEEIEAFVEEARNAGVRTGSHAQGTRGIKNAVLAGVDNIEHGIYLDDDVIGLMVERGTTLVPTFAVADAIVKNGRKAGVREASVLKAESLQAAHIASFKRAYRAGVVCGCGTDYLGDPMLPMGANADEIVMYVDKIGLSPMEALVCATRNNAIVLGLQDRIGTLETGKQADLIVIDGDPLTDVGLLRQREKILAVFKGGQLMPRIPF